MKQWREGQHVNLSSMMTSKSAGVTSTSPAEGNGQAGSTGPSPPPTGDRSGDQDSPGAGEPKQDGPQAQYGGRPTGQKQISIMVIVGDTTCTLKTIPRIDDADL
jgi:hypothetical protein